MTNFVVAVLARAAGGIAAWLWRGALAKTTLAAAQLTVCERWGI